MRWGILRPNMFTNTCSCIYTEYHLYKDVLIFIYSYILYVPFSAHLSPCYHSILPLVSSALSTTLSLSGFLPHSLPLSLCLFHIQHHTLLPVDHKEGAGGWEERVRGRENKRRKDSGSGKEQKNKHKTLRCKKAYGSACLSEDSGPWRSKQRRTKKIKTWAGNRAKKSKQRKSTPRPTQIKKRTMIDIEKHIDVFRGSDRIFRRREREAALGRPGWRSVPVFEILLTAKAISWRWLCCQLLGWLAVKYGGWESAASSPRQPDGWSPRGEEQQQEKMGEVRTVGGRRAEERNIRKR